MDKRSDEFIAGMVYMDEKYITEYDTISEEDMNDILLFKNKRDNQLKIDEAKKLLQNNGFTIYEPNVSIDIAPFSPVPDVAVEDSPLWKDEERRLAKFNHMDAFGKTLGWKK